MKKRTLFALLLITIAIVGVSVMYLRGYLVLPITSTNEETIINTVPTVELTFTDVEQTPINTALDLKDGYMTKYFKMKNEGNPIYVGIYWKNLTNSFTDGSLQYTLSTSTTQNGIYTPLISNIDVPTGTITEMPILAHIEVPKGDSYYKLEVKLLDLEYVDQTSDYNATFNSNFKLIASTPVSYQQVEYIESTGTQYIDTFYTPDYDKNINIEIISLPSVVNSRYCLLSNYNASKNLSLELKDNKGRIWYEDTNSSLNIDICVGSVSTNKKNLYIFNFDSLNKKYFLNLNGEITYGDMNVVGKSNQSMFVFIDQKKRFSVFNKPIKLYTLKILENDALIRNFIPCYRKSDYEIGLYDIVNDVFYTNQGTGTFEKGPNV